MNFDLNTALRVFRLIATHGSFTRAAAEMEVSTSALSQSLRQLEDHLGVRLLHRSTRRVALTEAGEIFLARINPALADIDSAIDSIRPDQTQPTGRLKITLPHIAVALILKPVLTKFMQSYPKIQLDIDTNDGLVDIVGEGFDVGIRLGEALQREMIAVPLGGKIYSKLVATPAYFKEHGIPKHPRDIQKHLCICHRFVTSGILHKWDFEQKGNKLEIVPEGPLIVNDNDIRLFSVLQGVGLAYAFETEVKEYIASGELISVLENWLPPFDGFYLYYASRTHLPPKLRVFIDFMREQFPFSPHKKS